MNLTLLLALLPYLAVTQEDPTEELGELQFFEEELEETEEELEDSDVVDDWWWGDSNIPSYLNNHDQGIMSGAIHQGLTCGSCGQVSGVQALEGRIALVSENYVPYSIQNFMNCDGRVCVGTQPYRMATQVRKNGWIVPEEEMPWTKAACKKWGPGKSKCLCGHKMGNYTNVLDDQFVFIGPTIRANTESMLKIALQTGPATTCYTRYGAKKLGAKCRSGCSHANSIIGYTEDSFILQESYGKGWGQFGNGTWETNKTNACGRAVLQKAYFTAIFYDYDRANAYYEEVLVEEYRLKFLDFEPGLHFTEEDLLNIGRAKNRCAYLGAYCKGVFQTSSGEFKLVSGVAKKSKKAKKKNKNSNVAPVLYFQKKQMVIYLKNDDTGDYLRVKMKKKGNAKLIMSGLKKATPFFTSYGRLISYNNPQYHLIKNKLVKIEGDIKISRNVDKTATWALDDCNIRNRKSGMSLALSEIVKSTKKKTFLEYGITGRETNLTADTQRFNVGISRKWRLVSTKLGKPLLRDKKTRTMSFSEPGGKKRVTYLRWNARQMLTSIGKAFDENFERMPGYFKFSGEPENAVVPTNCKLVKESNRSNRLVLGKKKKVQMSHGANREDGERWTLEPGLI